MFNFLLGSVCQSGYPATKNHAVNDAKLHRISRRHIQEWLLKFVPIQSGNYFDEALLQNV